MVVNKKTNWKAMCNKTKINRGAWAEATFQGGTIDGHEISETILVHFGPFWSILVILFAVLRVFDMGSLD